MSEVKKEWYVVRAIGGKEHKVKEYIEAEIRHNHLEDYISQILIPTEKVYTIRNGKKISKEKVSYPGYVLVEAAFVGQIPIIIRNTPNVLGFLGDTKEDSSKMNATPLRPQEVSRILGRVDELNAQEDECKQIYNIEDIGYDAELKSKSDMFNSKDDVGKYKILFEM